MYLKDSCRKDQQENGWEIKYGEAKKKEKKNNKGMLPGAV